MAVDVLNFPDLQDVERQIADREMREDIGHYYSGDQVSQKVGYGLEMDGLREYVPGDDARHIDWDRTAAQGDGTILWRKHYAERAPLTVIISDMASHEKYANTLGNPASARTLGYIAAHLVAQSAAHEQSPVLTLWSNGYRDFDRSIRVHEGPATAELSVSDGFRAGIEASEQAKDQRDSEARSRGVFKRRGTGGSYESPALESLTELLDKSQPITQRYAEAARFVVISGFGGDSSAAIERMELMKRYNDVVGIQITHPLMRELPADVTEVSIGNGKSMQIESDAQRALYSERASERLAHTQEQLRAATHGFIELDTVDPRLSLIRTQA